MSTKKLKDILKSLPTTAPSEAKLPISMDKQGQMYKSSTFLNLRGKEAAGSTIGIVDFAKTYLQDIPVGSFISDALYNTSQAWFVKVNDNLTINPQSYLILIAKKYQNLTQTWSLWTLILFPSVPQATPIVICLRTQSTTDVNIMVYDFFGQSL